MGKTLKLFHFIGMSLFLGSIAVFTMISVLTEASPLQEVSFGRSVISSGAYYITLPGLWLAIASGLLMVFRSRSLSEGWLKVKLALAFLIALNAHLVIVPAANNALAHASSGELSPLFQKALLTESVAGGINVTMTILAMIAGVVKFGRKRQKGSETSK